MKQELENLFGDRIAIEFLEFSTMYIPLTQKIVEPRKEQNMLGGGTISHTIFDEIVSLENMFDAWQDFARGKLGRTDVRAFGRYAEERIITLHGLLRDGIWRHGRYEAFRVCDPKPRKVHKASVADRVVHHAVARVIEPLFDRSFIFESWACRRDKGTHQSVEYVHRGLERLSRHGSRPLWILHLDIKKYFEHINHEVLFGLIVRRVSDVNALGLIKQIIESFEPGLPLGNLTSQLFANIYLNPFDHYIKEQVRPFLYARYCDDFLLVHSSRAWLRETQAPIQTFLERRLHLAVHPQKIWLRPFRYGIDWLGYVLFPGYRVLRPCTRARMWRHIRRAVDEYLAGQCSRELLRSTIASYDGIIQHGWNNHDRKLLMKLLQSI